MQIGIIRIISGAEVCRVGGIAGEVLGRSTDSGRREQKAR